MLQRVPEVPSEVRAAVEFVERMRELCARRPGLYPVEHRALLGKLREFISFSVVVAPGTAFYASIDFESDRKTIAGFVSLGIVNLMVDIILLHLSDDDIVLKCLSILSYAFGAGKGDINIVYQLDQRTGFMGTLLSLISKC